MSDDVLLTSDADGDFDLVGGVEAPISAGLGTAPTARCVGDPTFASPACETLRRDFERLGKGSRPVVDLTVYNDRVSCPPLISRVEPERV